MSAVGRIVLGVVALIGVASTTGCVSSQVTAVTASPDGRLTCQSVKGSLPMPE
jgi:hypothetical protein